MSFALPTVYPGGRADVPGIGALYLAVMVGPVAGVQAAAGTLDLLEGLRATAYSLYFLVLAAQNVVIPLALSRRGQPSLRVRVAASLLASAVALVPFADLYELLELADGERVRLLGGYVAWVASFWLAALASFVEAREPQPLKG